MRKESLSTFEDLIVGFFPGFVTRRLKTHFELRFWKRRKRAEGTLSNAHYVFLYTTHFRFDREFYRDKRILDIGCGPRGSLEWADKASECVGLDPLAKEYLRLGPAQYRMKYVASRSEDIPYPDGYFQVVSSMNSLDHLNDLNLSVREIVRVLAPGGFFLLLVDIHQQRRICEPTAFSWDIVKKFTPYLDLIEERHYEKDPNGITQSLLKGTPFNHSNHRIRYGVLSALFRKPVNAR
jgi:SAM-dependent methyltransferase